MAEIKHNKLDVHADVVQAMQVDPCLETYDSDQDAGLGSAGADPTSERLSQALLQQAATASGRRSHLSSAARQADSASMPAIDQHSPDSSATLTGSGPCSDASDLTSSHPSDHPKHHHKRLKLGSTQSAQRNSLRHPAAQCAPDPNLAETPTLEEASALLQGQQGVQLSDVNPFGAVQAGTDNQLRECHVLFQPTLSPPQNPQRLQDRDHPVTCPQWQVPVGNLAPAYVPCVVPGLTPSQQLVKEQEEEELAQALRRQQNVYTAGYEMDDFGAVRLPTGQYKHVVSMKVVFAQRWQREAKAAAPANAAQLSMKQLLLDEAVQPEVELASNVATAECRLPQGALQKPLQPERQLMAAPANAKLPIRLSNLKNAMRKAELGGPELSSSTSSGNHGQNSADDKHLAWQVGQLSNTPLLNNVWVEYYVDRFNTDFDSSYWSMLDSLSARVE